MKGKHSRVQFNKLSIRTGDTANEAIKVNRSVIFSTFSQGDSPIFLVNTSRAASFNFKHSLKFKDPLKILKKPVKIVQFPYDGSVTKTRKPSKTFVSMFSDNIRKSITRKHLFYQLEGVKDHKQLSHLSSRVNSRNSKKFEAPQKKVEFDLEGQCLTINRLTSLNRTQQNSGKFKAKPILQHDEKEDPDYLFFKNKLISEYLTENSTE